MPQILVTKPGVLDQRDKSKLRRAGIITVEADNPSDVKLIDPAGGEIGHEGLLYAAMKGINADSYEVRSTFAKVLLSEMERVRAQAQEQSK